MWERGWQVLLVDSDGQEQAQIQRVLERHCVGVTALGDEAAAVEWLETHPHPDAIVLAVHAPATDGAALLGALEAGQEDGTSLFLVTEAGREPDALRTGSYPVDKVLYRPFDSGQFLAAVGEKALGTVERLPDRPAHAAAPPSTARAPSRSAGASTAPAAHGDSPVGRELRDYWKALLRHKMALIVTATLALAVAMGISAMLTPKYEATATIRIASAAGGQFDYTASMLATRLANTYVEIATTDPIQDELMARLNLTERPSVKVEVVPETELLTITAEQDDPAVAQQVANTLAEIMIERSMSYYAGDSPTAVDILAGQLAQAKADLDAAEAAYLAALNELAASQGSAGGPGVSGSDLEVLRQQVVLRQQLYSDLLQRYEDSRMTEQLRSNAITIVERAALPKSPSSPNLVFNGILGLGAGLTGGLLLVLVQETLDNSVADYAQLQSLTAQPIIGQIPPVRGVRRRKMTIAHNPVLADIFRGIQARLQIDELTHGRRPVILVTSPEPGTGKSSVAANLARSMAQSGERVLLVDADLHRPSLHRAFNLPQQGGLSDVLLGTTSLSEALQITAEENLTLLTSGRAHYEISGKASTAKLNTLFRTLASSYDYLIVDSPGVLATGYTTLLARQADAVVMVVAQHFTDRQDLRMATEQLREVGASEVGVILNRAEPIGRHHYYAYRRRAAR